jgi:hypothetical protein
VVWEVVKSLLKKALRKRGFFMLKYPKRGETMLVIVKTTGSFMLSPYDGGATPLIEAGLPTLCKLTPFIQYRVKLGQLKILAENVPETATQSGILAGIQAADGDVEAYIKSLTSALQLAKEVPPIKNPSPTAKTKKSI